MLSIIPLLFIGSVSCIPIFSTNIFKIGCSKPIHQDLDLDQGLRPDIQNNANFGYLYRLDMPTLRLGPDITIHHQSELLPSQAASILSSISYDEFNSKLVIRGRISKLNSYRLNRVPSIKGAMMTVRFDTFGAQNNMWYNQLGSSPGGITGRIENLNIVQQTDGRNIHQELVIELSPEPALYHNNEYLHYKHSSAATIKQIDWTGSGKNGCRTHKQVNNRKDRFHETFESAVLL